LRFAPASAWVLVAFRWLLRRWVQATVIDADAVPRSAEPQRPVCYALQFRQLSALMVLEEQAERLGLPAPLAPLQAGAVRERNAFFFLTRSGQPSPLRHAPYRYAPRLARLVEAVRADPAFDPQLVPVHVFWGRAPERQDSILAALLAEGWVIPGGLRQLARVAIHGRATLLKFGAPRSLRSMIDGAEDTALAIRRAARLLRTEFRQERERVIGPNLSHRFTLINALIESPVVSRAIDEEAARRGIGRDQAEAAARRHAWEIASNYSYPFVRAFDLALKLLWNRLYDGVVAHRLDEARTAAADATLVYVPCHRSHIDYLLLSFLIWHEGLPPPHVAAGANLDLPLVGPLLRRGGAFFLRRSFRDDPLYGAVFGEYLHLMIERGHAIEYFVEGGRSRTGRMLAPKAGLLAMTVRSALRAPARPLVFIPVYIGYERLLEGPTYVAELSGRPKQKESLLGLASSLRSLRERFGQVHVNVGEPIRLDRMLAGRGILSAASDAVTRPDPVAAERSPDDDPALRSAVDALAVEIVRRINDAVVVNPVNLLSVAMLGAPRGAMDAQQLEQQIGLLQALLALAPYSDRQVVSALTPAEVIGHAERDGVLRRIVHPLGDMLLLTPDEAGLLAYFRNNVLHAFAMPALLACVLAQQETVDGDRLVELARRMLAFLRAELFLSWTDQALPARVLACIDTFRALGLMRSPLAGEPSSRLRPPAPGTPGSVALHALAEVMRQPLERYFITLSVLCGQGSDRLGARSLEDLCSLLAQRMAYLHEPSSPEFFDRASFRAVIATLAELGWIWEREGRLVFGEALAVAADDAPMLLSGEVRRAIAQLTRLSPDDVARAQAALAER